MIFAAKVFRLALSSLAAAPKPIPVGGQAVIEGVLMKGPEHWGLAVREPKGGILLKTWPCSEWPKKGFWKYPVARGFATMVEMLRVGMRALSLSAEISLGEEEKITPLETALTIAAALVCVGGIFVALPMFASEFLAERLGLTHIGKNIAEGAIRGVVFVAYVALISLWKDIARVFEYHGAEHKTINAYENGAELTPAGAAPYSRIHRRCGTSFLIIVILVSIIVFSAIGGGSVIMRVGGRIVLLPVVIGLSYEFIRAASNSGTWGLWSIKPALLLQYITTREPSPDQLEVAIAALSAALDPSGDNMTAGGAEDGTDR